MQGKTQPLLGGFRQRADPGSPLRPQEKIPVAITPVIHMVIEERRNHIQRLHAGQLVPGGHLCMNQHRLHCHFRALLTRLRHRVQAHGNGRIAIGMDRGLPAGTVELHHLPGKLLWRLIGKTQVFRRMIVGHPVIGFLQKAGIALQGTITDQFHRPQMDPLPLRQGPLAVLACFLRSGSRPDAQSQGNQPEP